MYLRSTKAVTTTPSIAAFMASFTMLATKVIKSEVLFASFVAEHNLPINVSEHAGRLLNLWFLIQKLQETLLQLIQKQMR